MGLACLPLAFDFLQPCNSRSAQALTSHGDKEGSASHDRFHRHPLHGGDDTHVDCEDCGANLGTLDDVKTLVSLQLLGRKTAAPSPFLLLN
jgi:hypothetical protein